MNPVWKLRGAAGLGLGLAIASAVLLRPSEVADPFTANAEPQKQAAAPPAKPRINSSVNTGRKAEEGFIIDLKAGFDDETQYLSAYEMDADWIKIAYKPSNVRWSKDGMKLELQKTRGKLPFAGAEFQRVGWYGYGRYEAVMKASDGYGAVASFFTFTDTMFDNPHDEIDFEFLGKSTRSVHLNYFHDGANDPLEAPLWFDTSTADHLYAFEWTPDSIKWFADGHLIREVQAKTSKAGIPTTTGKVVANIWAGAGPAQTWTGEPRLQDASAEYRCMSHVPAGKTGKQCSDTFKAPPKP
jgi:endo-1,3-1,4-beta-glycanase ExoK